MFSTSDTIYRLATLRTLPEQVDEPTTHDVYSGSSLRKPTDTHNLCGVFGYNRIRTLHAEIWRHSIHWPIPSLKYMGLRQGWSTVVIPYLIVPYHTGHGNKMLGIFLHSCCKKISFGHRRRGQLHFCKQKVVVSGDSLARITALSGTCGDPQMALSPVYSWRGCFINSLQVNGMYEGCYCPRYLTGELLH